MLGHLGELCLYKMWTIYLQLVAGVNARPKDSSFLALRSLFFSAVSSPGSSFSYWNLLSIYAINLSPFSSTRVSHCLHIGHSQITSHNKDTFGMEAQTRTSHENGLNSHTISVSWDRCDGESELLCLTRLRLLS